MSLVLTPNPIPMDPNDRHARHAFAAVQTEASRAEAAYERSSTGGASRPKSSNPESYAVVDYSARRYADSSNVRPEIVTSPSHAPTPRSNGYTSPDLNVYHHHHSSKHALQQPQRPQNHTRLPSLQTILGPQDDSPRSPYRQPLLPSEHGTNSHASAAAVAAPHTLYPSAYTPSPPSSSSGPPPPPPLTRPPPTQDYHPYSSGSGGGGGSSSSRPPTQSSSLGFEQSGSRWPVTNEALPPADLAASVGTRSPYSESASSARYSAAPSDILTTAPPPPPPPPPPLHRSHASSLSAAHPPRSSHIRSTSEQSGSDHGASPHELARPAVAGEQTDRAAAPTSAASPTASGPQCLGTQNIGEEGLCYVYTDGTYCRTEIAGEPVNPEWGVTKAGKPRKRLAQACISCREKKIKCEPGYPKCNQCSKLGRECKRSSHNRSSPDATPAASSSSGSSNGGGSGDHRPGSSHHHQPHREREGSRDRSITPKALYTANGQQQQQQQQPQPQQQQRPAQEQQQQHHSPEKYGARPASPVTRDSPGWRLSKKARVSTEGSGNYSGYADPANHNNTTTTNADTNNPNDTPLERDVAASGSSLNHLISRLSWDTDPIEVLPNTCTKLIHHAFAYNVERSIYTLFPGDQFFRWLHQCRWKDKDDRMLIYSLMALGFTFENYADAAMKLVGLRIAEVATAAVHEQLGRHANSIQLVQSRLFLHTYYVSRGRFVDGWEQLGATCRVMLSLGLNKESGILSLPMTSLEGGFTQNQAYECRRRTFWLAYLFNCYSGFFRGRVSLLSDSDIFLRLPNNEADYLDRCTYLGPLFDAGCVDWTAHQSERMGSMAMLVGIASIFNSVYAHAYRAINSSRPENMDAYEQFHNSTTARLEEWQHRLPAKMQHNPGNLARAHEERRFAMYLNVHAMHYVTRIALARYGPVKNLSATTVRRNICEAYRNTRHLLMLTNAVCRDHLDGNKRTGDVEMALSQPFLAYCIVSACDVACSGGKVESLQTTISCLTNAVRILDEIARLWSLARDQSELINERLCDLSAHAMSGRDGNFWRIERPFAGAVIPLSYDITYGSLDELYYEATEEFSSSG